MQKDIPASLQSSLHAQLGWSDVTNKSHQTSDMDFEPEDDLPSLEEMIAWLREECSREDDNSWLVQVFAEQDETVAGTVDSDTNPQPAKEESKLQATGEHVEGINPQSFGSKGTPTQVHPAEPRLLINSRSDYPIDSSLVHATQIFPVATPVESTSLPPVSGDWDTGNFRLDGEKQRSGNSHGSTLHLDPEGRSMPLSEFLWEKNTANSLAREAAGESELRRVVEEECFLYEDQSRSGMPEEIPSQSSLLELGSSNVMKQSHQISEADLGLADNLIAEMIAWLKICWLKECNAEDNIPSLEQFLAHRSTDESKFQAREEQFQSVQLLLASKSKESAFRKRPFEKILPAEMHVGPSYEYQDLSTPIQGHKGIDLLAEKDHICAAILGSAPTTHWEGLDVSLSHILFVHERCLRERTPFHIQVECASQNNNTAEKCCWSRQFGKRPPDDDRILRSFRQMCTRVVNSVNSIENIRVQKFPDWVKEEMRKFLDAHPQKGKGIRTWKKEEMDELVDSLGLKAKQVLGLVRHTRDRDRERRLRNKQGPKS